MTQSKIRCQENSQGRKEFINWNLDEQVIIPGLSAAVHTLLLQPVAERAYRSYEKALPVAKDAGEQDDINSPEQSCIANPALFIPEQTNYNRGDGQSKKDCYS